MPKSRKRKTPIVSSIPTDAPTSSKPQLTRSVIREFHVLLKRQTQLFNIQKNSKSSGKGASQYAEAQAELDKIQARIEELGGLERYQHMSAVGQKDDRGGGSHKLLIGWMKELSLHKDRQHGKLKLLEVGALLPDNYQSCSSWIESQPIDLNSRHPLILEQDFFLLEPQENHEKWGVISLSLVLNFVPDPKDRGRMLRMAHDMLTPAGYLFVALPLPCVSNSRYLTFDHFKSLMAHLGFNEIRSKWREGGKMVYYLYQKEPPASSLRSPPPQFTKKIELRSGANRNNFTVLLG